MPPGRTPRLVALNAKAVIAGSAVSLESGVGNRPR